MKNLKLPALTAALLLTTAFTVAQAQTGQQSLNANNDAATLYFLVDTGRAGAVDLFVDGQKVVAQALATDAATLLNLTPGSHNIMVKTAYDGLVVTQGSINLAANQSYALGFQNNDGATDYTLAFFSGNHSIQQLINGD
ncbi:DUF4397 domain-containing protein [Deinococcus sp. QL22]|uniref:DUF4397 domain-containing protein n=1 Tax=Deinococcus sp. QL22 TaxID=2939437 RepID=UPI00201813E1|nr:DUF4397 domain-containing protein [Deinococcus sp. QL22]UQN07537.1 DUF4397 domain-containing protein [Deinococcus sp. QL22]